MKHILLILFSFSMSGLFGQDLTIAPSPASSTGSPTDPYIKVFSNVTNNTNAAMDVTWERYNVQAPTEWTTSVCDKNFCYADFQSSETFSLGAGETENLDIWFLPDNVVGVGTAEIRIYNAADSANTVVSNTYTATASTSTNNEDVLAVKYKVFPNPASNYVQLPQIDDIGEIRLYDILGKVIHQEFADQGNIQHLNVTNLPKGTYLLQFLDEKNNILHTTRVIKQ